MSDSWVTEKPTNESYEPSIIYKRATNGKGFSTTSRVNFPPDISAAISELVASRLTDYRTSADFHRDAAVHRLFYWQSVIADDNFKRKVTITALRAESERRAEEYLNEEKMLESFKERIEKAKHDRDEIELAAIKSDAHIAADYTTFPRIAADLRRIRLRRLVKLDLLTSPPMPDWFSRFRPEQVIAVDRILEAYENGANLVVLDAPTGSGKTLIAETVRRQLQVRRTQYVCSTKTLQDQFANDYSYAALLKGRSNYPTLTPGHVTAADCTKTLSGHIPVCAWCPNIHECPYEIAKHTALSSPLTVLNTTYALTEWNYIGRFSNANLVIMDECDTLEQELMKFVGLEIGSWRVKKWRLGEPAKVTKPDAWWDWASQALPTIYKHIPDIDDTETDVTVIREWQYATNLYGKVQQLKKGLESGEWIYTGKNGSVSFKPIRVTTWGPTTLWKHSSRWLLMSATVISPEELVDSLGWTGPWESVSMDSTFPVRNRPVCVAPVADMSRKANERENLSLAVRRILENHPNERVLVHTVSYDLAAFLHAVEDGYGRDGLTFTYRTASEREETLERFKNTESGVLFAPSLDRGVDLPDDLCRVIVVAKVPFPYLGDRQISARLHSPGGQMWYTVQTVRSLVQMTGRATRHSTDFSTGYLLDSQFTRLYNSSGRGLFPKWWTAALTWKVRL